MTIKTATTIMGKPGERLTDEMREAAEAQMAALLDKEDLDPETKREAMANLMKLFERSGTLEGLSAASIAKSLEATADGLEGCAKGIAALGFSLSKQGKGRRSFEMGEASGMLSACRALLGSIGDHVLHAIACDCNGHPEEAETIPPPAPGPEEAA